MFKAFLKAWRRVILLFTGRKNEQEEKPKVDDSQPRLNRAARRQMDARLKQLERRRLKLDKFVEPSGPAPYKTIKRGEARPKPETVDEVGEIPTRQYIVKEHHSDRKTKVLFDADEDAGEFNFRDTILEQ